MLLELKQIFQNEGLSLDIDFELDWSGLEINGEYPFKKPARVKGKVCNRTGLVNMVINVTFVYNAPCDRCGVQTADSYNMKFSHKLVTSLEGEDEGDYIVLRNYGLEIDELVVSDVLLELPAKHLCSENCKGLCSMCGANLNLGSCDCKEDNTDPRLAVLKRLLEEK